MAEGRILKKKASLDERLALLSPSSLILFLLAIPHLDREGRISGIPAAMRGTVVPAIAAERPEIWTDKFVEAYMLEWTWSERPLVKWYCVRGIWVCEFQSFKKHQAEAALNRENPSIFPPAPDENPVLRTDDLNPQPPLKTCVSRSGSQSEEGANAPRAENREAIKTVYDCWRTERAKTNSRYDQISDARRKKIAARLREFTVDELCKAIRAVALDPWVDRPRHDDLIVIFNSREQVERFLGFAEYAVSSTERPFVCEHNGCDLRFVTQRRLDEHVENVHAVFDLAQAAEG